MLFIAVFYRFMLGKIPSTHCASGFCRAKKSPLACRGGVYPPAPKEPAQPFRRYFPAGFIFSLRCGESNNRMRLLVPLSSVPQNSNKTGGQTLRRLCLLPTGLMENRGVCATPEKCFSLQYLSGSCRAKKSLLSFRFRLLLNKKSFLCP